MEVLNTWAGEDQGFEHGTGASIAKYKNKLSWQARVNHSKPHLERRLISSPNSR